MISRSFLQNFKITKTMRKIIALTFILIGILVFSVFNTLATKAITLEEVQAQQYLQNLIRMKKH